MRWEADTGLDPKKHWNVKTGSYKTLDDPDGYQVKDEWGVVSEICCEELDCDGIEAHEVKGVSEE